MKAKSSKVKTETAAKRPKTGARKATAKAGPKAAKATTKTSAKKSAAPRGVKKTSKAASKPGARALKAVPKPTSHAAPASRGRKRPARPPAFTMRRKEVERFRSLLLSKRQDLMRAYSISKGDSQSALDNGTEDYVDYAVNSYAREFLLSLTELDRKQLLLVEEALARVDRGEYGRCQQCGEEINPKRLEVQPWARHCVRCQELEEQGLLPQYPFQPSDDEEDSSDERDESTPLDEELEAESESEDEALDEEPLVVDGDDSEE